MGASRSTRFIGDLVDILARNVGTRRALTAGERGGRSMDEVSARPSAALSLPRLAAGLLLAAAAFGCSSQPSQLGAGGAGSSSVSSSASTTHAASSSVVASSSGTGNGGAGGGGVVTCDPPPEKGSLYERTATNNMLDTVSMCGYRGEVLLIVNIAAV
jgi:hypothetical protein